MEKENISVGWAEVDITPDKPVLLHGQFYTRISEYVNDPVTATALVISGEKDSLIFVSCDLIYLYEPVIQECREKIKKEMPEIDVNKISFGATHTHTAPTMKEGLYIYEDEKVMKPSEYAEFLVEKLSKCVIEAWKNREKGYICWGMGHTVVGHNRRMVYFDGSAKMYGDTNDKNFSHIEGYEDHSVDLLFTYNKEKQLTGMIINLSCPSQVTENARFVSADFWHEARQEIRKRISKDLFILPQCAPAGDQSPHLLLYKKGEERMRKLKGLSEREEIGKRITDAVEKVLPYAEKDIREKVELKHITKTINLPRRMVTDEEYKQAKEEIEKWEKKEVNTDKEKSHKFVMIRRNKEVIERYHKQKENPILTMELHVIRLGDIAFATNRFELFLDYGMRIEARSKAVQTFLVQLSNGEGTYLPTKRAVNAKGYGAEIASNLVGPEGGQVLVEETVEEINNLFKEEGGI